jgi:hypothetical protein
LQVKGEILLCWHYEQITLSYWECRAYYLPEKGRRMVLACFFKGRTKEDLRQEDRCSHWTRREIRRFLEKAAMDAINTTLSRPGIFWTKAPIPALPILIPWA